MIRANDNFNRLPEAYLFSEVASRIRQYKEQHPGLELIKMDIGDIKRPLFPCVTEAMRRAVDDLSRAESFYGYGPEQGYAFLREAIEEHDYHKRGIDIGSSEIFVSDGAKSDLGNLGDILDPASSVGICNPTYPAYLDDSVINGMAGKPQAGGYSNVIDIECRPEDGFIPALPAEVPDVIYLCFPNNPTGVGIDRDRLAEWVEYAHTHGALIVYDAAYQAYVREEGVVRSIYEIPGADEVAIEVNSFSKTAGFTGVRCGYTVVPRRLTGRFSSGRTVSLNTLWNRRQSTKFNGASYVSQRGAEAVYSPEGRANVKEATDAYLENAAIVKEALAGKNIPVYGGVNSPYVWARMGENSWDVFDFLLREAQVSVTPGIGFGTKGEGYVRFTGFNTRGNTLKAMERILQKL